MIHALHGNVGLPDDLHGLLTSLQRPSNTCHLWQWLRDHPQHESPGSFAAALNDTARQLDEHPRSLLGYSLGGRLALHALIQAPSAWEAAVIISAHPGLGGDSGRAARLEQDQRWAKRFLHEPWDELMAEWNAQSVFLPCSGGRCMVSESWRREISRAFDVWSVGRQADLRPLLPSVTCPVLWLTGGQDEKFTSLAVEAVSLMPHAQHTIIPDAGHRVHLDQPAATAAAITTFLVTAGC